MQIQLKKHHGQYSKYKKTGIPWLGEVPFEWAMEKLKFVAPIQNKKIVNPSPELQYIALENVESWTGNLINLNEKVEFESIVNGFEAGDVLFGKLRPYLAKVVPTEFNGVCTSEMIVLRPRDGKIINKFLFYRLISNAFINVVNNSTYGAKMPRANWSFIGNLLFGFPKPEEQKVISNYLDEKSALIERIIALKKKQIELLKEKRSALINRVVTKGIRIKVMFDTNAFDQWLKLSKKNQNKLLERVEIIYTHIQEDELPSHLRGVLSSAKKVSTSGAIFDISRYDHCTYGSEEDSSNINAVVGRAEKENHNKDALIANTAKMQSYLLVTDDQRLQKKCSEIGSEAIPFKEFIARFEMKDSGVEWIGRIPQCWRVSRLKFLTNKTFQYGANEAALEEDVTQPRFVRITDVDENGNLRDDTFKSLNETLAKDFLLEDGDILFARSGATVGKTFQYKDSWGKCSFAGYLIRFSPDKKKIASDFCNYITSSRYYQEWKNSIFIQATIQNISAEKYKNFWVAFPLLEEQNRIIKYLDFETKKIDLAIQKIDLSIALLQEYKTSLISNMVTGKVNVITT